MAPSTGQWLQVRVWDRVRRAWRGSRVARLGLARWLALCPVCFFLITLDTGPSRLLRLELCDTEAHEPAERALSLRGASVGGWAEGRGGLDAPPPAHTLADAG